MAELGPVRRQVAVQAAEQQHQLGAVNAVPQEGGQQEEVKQRRHRCTRACVWLHELLGGQDGVGPRVGLPGDFVLPAGVSGSGEEGDHEGQQGDVDAEEHHPGLDTSLRYFEEAEKFRSSYSDRNMVTHQVRLTFSGRSVSSHEHELTYAKLTANCFVFKLSSE